MICALTKSLSMASSGTKLFSNGGKVLVKGLSSTSVPVCASNMGGSAVRKRGLSVGTCGYRSYSSTGALMEAADAKEG